MNTPSSRAAASGTGKRSRIYLLASLLATLIALVGFWPTYFGRLIVGTLVTVPSVHLHAAAQLIWLALFIAQVALAAAGRIALHMRIGRWLMAYGAIMICVGVIVTFDRFGARFSQGDPVRAKMWLFGVLRDLVFFAPFLVAGWSYRHKPETHKRLMLVATTILLLPAVGRMSFLGTPVPLWKYMLVWPLPIYVAMIHDYATKKLVHRAYVIGVAAMLTMRLVLPLRTSSLWLEIAGWLANIALP